MEGTRTTFSPSPRSGPSSPSPRSGPSSPSPAGTHAPPTAGTHASPPAIVFTVEEIRQFTDNFATLIGEGGFGYIYSGHLEDQNIVVKASKAGQAKREEWLKEIEFLQMCNHPNVIKLLGVGEDPAEARFFLVYPYFGKGALQNSIAASRKYGYHGIRWSPLSFTFMHNLSTDADHSRHRKDLLQATTMTRFATLAQTYMPVDITFPFDK
ncbi:probable serine/threonine-protein kinase PBL3 isoform X2 [Rhododendron vialii]|uniref:probable serine/threonine-protein kinase PBL3 isoform X2 n=1 Tax=Rhododendron vialii TaxID=182163 RepID=UPI00265EBD80|nr:probable serine/threonine-protein kinase PBL3 isoform X2 [Rhododendron vialii]